MSCPTVKKAFEDSLNKSNLNNSDKFLVDSNGTIYNVTFGDVVTQAGLTGALTGLNGGSATPVLKGTAPDYQIRGIVGGAGINVGVNASDSITVSAQLSNSGNTATGAPLIPNPSASTIALRRIAAGQGIDITTESDRLVISNSEIAVTNNTTIISNLADFPAPVSGVITLADDTEYFVANNISTSNRFVLGSNTVISSGDVYTTALTYTGTGTMFTLNNGRSGIKEIGLSCPNGQLFDGSAVTTGNFLTRWLLIYEVKDIGALGHPIIGLYDWFVGLHTGNGLDFTSVTNGRLKTSNLTFGSSTNAAATMIDLGIGTFDELSILGTQFLNTVSGQTFITGAADGANMNAGTVGFINNTSIEGDMVMLNTITLDDAGFDFESNNKLADTNPRAQVFLAAQATTTIGVTGTPVVASGTFTTDDVQLYDTNVNGRSTYKGVRNKFARIDTTISFEPASGTNKDIFVQLFINGAALAPTKITRTSSAGSSAVVSVDWSTTLSTNDFVEVAVGNDTDTTDIVVNQLLIRVA